MKALVYTGPTSLEYRAEPDPVVSEGEVLVKVAACGVCGSDMHAYFGHDERRKAPLILGHEVSGEVISSARAGERVVVNPLVSCGRCDYCLDGRANLCLSREIISMPPREGGFAELLRIPERNLVPIPDSMSYLSAALTEPVATAMHALRAGERLARVPSIESRALVFGAGAIGLAAALILKSHGLRSITIVEPNESRRLAAARTGACDTLDPMSDGAPEADGYDLIIDAVGAAVTRKSASRAIKPGGVIVHIGLMDNEGGLDIRKLTLREVIFIGCYTYTMVDFKAALAALDSGALGRLDWVEGRPLSEGAAAFEELAGGGARAAKIALIPD